MPSYYSKPVCSSCHEAGHTWSSSCIFSTLEIFYNCFRYSLKLYSPLYVVSGIVSGRKKEYFAKKLFKEILQSSLFLASNGGFMVLFFCVLRKILGAFHYYSIGFLPGFLSSYCAILIERKGRRGNLAVYMMNQAVETIFNILKYSGYVRDIQYGEVMIFAVATSILMYMYRTNNMPDGFIKTIFDKAFRRQEEIQSSRKDNSDFKHSLELTKQAFLAGYGLNTAYSLLVAVPQMFSNPGRIPLALVSKESFQAGAFMGSFVGLYKLMEVILSKYLKSKSSLNAAVAGGVAGLSMFFQRSSYIALYIASKTAELCYMRGIEKGLLPYFQHFDSFLYALCTGIMFHAAVLQPLFLRKQYWTFLLKLTGMRFKEIDRSKWDVWGLDSSKIDRIAGIALSKMT